MNKHIGKVLKFNEQAYNLEVRAWQQQVFPLLTNVVTLHNSLGTGPFDEETLQDLKSNDLSRIADKAHSLLQEDMKAFRTPGLQQAATESLEKHLQSLQDAWQKVEAVKSTNHSGSIYSITMDWDDVSFSNGAFQLNTETIRKRHETTIETEDEAALYQLMLNVKEAHGKLHAFLKERGARTRMPLVSDQGFLYEDADGALQIKPTAIKMISRANRMAFI